MTNTTSGGGVRLEIPAELRQIPRWLTWHPKDGHRRDGSPKVDKVPDPVDWTSSRSWSTFESLVQSSDNELVTALPRLGFVFTGKSEAPEQPQLLAFDLDSCRAADSGRVHAWAALLIARCNQSFTEVTPSGTGLRLWLRVRRPPKAWAGTHYTPLGAEPATNGKKVECQVFGTAAGQFVTVTGQKLAGTRSEIVAVDDLDFWPSVFGRPCERPEGDPSGKALDRLPVGVGEEPSMETILERLRAVDRGGRIEALLRGEIDGVERPEDEDGHRPETSNSEAYYRLVAAVLKAAEGHGRACVEFLLNETRFGLGGPGIDPKYGSVDWVTKDVCRIAGKTGIGAQMASPFVPQVPDAPPVTAGSSPGAGVAVGTDATLIPAGEFIRKAGKQLFLVKKTIARTGVTQFFGEPSSGKTPFVLSLGIALAMGYKSWFGHRIERTGLVVYLVGEDPDGVAHRISAECQVRGIEPDELGKNFVCSGRAGRLTQREDAQKWLQAIQQAAGGREVVAIIVDTQAQNFGPGSENAPEDMAAFTHHLEELCSNLRCAVLMTHHPGHGDKNRGRGHSSMDGFLNSRFEVVRTKRDDGAVVVTAHDKKHKNWAEQRPLVGMLVGMPCYTDADGEVVTAVTLQEEGANVFENEAEVVRMLAALAKLGAKATERTLATASGNTRHEVRRLLVVLVGRGFAEKVRNGAENTQKVTYVLTTLGVEALRISGCPLVEGGSTSEIAEALVAEAQPVRNQSISENHKVVDQQGVAVVEVNSTSLNQSYPGGLVEQRGGLRDPRCDHPEMLETQPGAFPAPRGEGLIEW